LDIELYCPHDDLRVHLRKTADYILPRVGESVAIPKSAEEKVLYRVKDVRHRYGLEVATNLAMLVGVQIELEPLIKAEQKPKQGKKKQAIPAIPASPAPAAEQKAVAGV